LLDNTPHLSKCALHNLCLFLTCLCCRSHFEPDSTNVATTTAVAIEYFGLLLEMLELFDLLSRLED